MAQVLALLDSFRPSSNTFHDILATAATLPAYDALFFSLSLTQVYSCLKIYYMFIDGLCLCFNIIYLIFFHPQECKFHIQPMTESAGTPTVPTAEQQAGSLTAVEVNQVPPLRTSALSHHIPDSMVRNYRNIQLPHSNISCVNF